MSCHAETLRRAYFQGADNCYWNPALSIHETATGDRIVKASKPVASGEPLVILSQERSLGSQRARNISHWDLTGLDDDLTVPAVLYQHFVGIDLELPPGFKDYTSSLPTYQWYASNHATVELERSIGPRVARELEHFIPTLASLRRFREWVAADSDRPFEAETVDRALLISVTRSWGGVGMVPFMDFFNHREDGCMLSAPNHQLSASRAYAPSEELHVSYGPKDALCLLSTYGFCGSDHTISLSRGELSRLALAVDPQLEDYGARMRITPFLLLHSLENFGDLVAEARLCAIDRHDLEAITDLAQQFKGVITIANEQRALAQVLAQLKGRRQYLKDQIALIESLDAAAPAQQWIQLMERQIATTERADQQVEQYWQTLLPRP